MSPVSVTSPPETETVTPVMPYLASAAETSVLSFVSSETGGGVALITGGLTVRLFVTDLTPSTLLASCSAFDLSASLLTVPASVTTPLDAVTVTLASAGSEASFALTLAARVASSGPLLQAAIAPTSKMLIPTDRTLVDNLIIRFSFSIGGSSTYFLALLDKRGDDLAEGRALDHRHVNDVDARGELSEFIMLMPLSTPRDN